MQKYYIVVPNWNGANHIRACLESLSRQSKAGIIVVDNDSSDESVKIINEMHPEAALIQNKRNMGFSGGVNTGIRYAMRRRAKYIALFNNDAIADDNWLKALVSYLDRNPTTGIVTGKIVASDKRKLDSTGECYTVWALPFPRGRGEPVTSAPEEGPVFGASGGASLYRVKMLEEIGLFDEDFFAYYEDVDISFRAQLAGWKIGYEPKAIAYHEIGATSGKIKGFTTYHTLKNLPFLLWKNVPWRLMPKIWPRLVLAWLGIAVSAIQRGHYMPLLKAIVVGTVIWPEKLIERYRIQKNRKVSVDYIDSIIVHDLPPNAYRLRALRSKWWKLKGRRADA